MPEILGEFDKKGMRYDNDKYTWHLKLTKALASKVEILKNVTQHNVIGDNVCTSNCRLQEQNHIVAIILKPNNLLLQFVDGSDF